MVRSFVIAAAALAWTGSAQAQAADWRRAGGDLFVGAAAATPEVRSENLPADNAPRIPALTQPYAEAVAVAAERYGLDPKLLHAMVIVESAYRADAVSRVGASGLTQLMPKTAAKLGVADRFDPAANLLGGAAYLARQVLRFGDVRLALAAYNAGPERVAHLGRVPDISETRAYVAAVVDCYLALTAGRGVRSARECKPQGSPG